MNKIKRIKELVDLLNKASIAYYKYSNPIMSDKKFDSLYDELDSLEKETGIILNNSPTQTINDEILPELKKVTHTRPMLSSNKTKDIAEIKKFVSKSPCVMSWKEDGLTIVVRYKDGKFVQAITRGQGGLIGEDVTHTMRMCSDIPMMLPYSTDLQVRGECLISYKEFNRINENLIEPYKNPRNLASGTVRQLDSSIAKKRKLSYKAFELDQNEYYKDKTMWEQIMTVEESFKYLEECGFNVVEHILVNKDNVEQMIESFNPQNYEFPVDGLIFKYNDVFYGKSLGETSKFPLDMIALKWKDEVVETKLKYIDWTMGKFGTLTPIAVFMPIEIDGTTVEKASLHNISVMKSLGIKAKGQTVYVLKSNMIIPQIDSADDIDIKENLIPETCPICNQPTQIIKENDSEVLICTNPNCKGKLLGKLSYAVSKKGFDIDGLSEATLQKFIDRGWLQCVEDIYHLPLYQDKISRMEGFGAKSTKKLMENIEKSKDITLDKFISALSIPLIGTTASKDIAKFCDYDIEKFKLIMGKSPYKFTKIEGFGDKMARSLFDWWSDNVEEFLELERHFRFKKIENNINVDKLKGQNFVITGKLHHFANRDALKEKIESLGGRVVGSISSNTSFLINNDVNSISSKNTKAKKLSIPIISEDDFVKMIRE